MSKHKDETNSKMSSLLRRGSGRSSSSSSSSESEPAGGGAGGAGPVYPFDSEKRRKSMWLQKEQADRLKEIARKRGYRGMAHLIIDTFDLNSDA